MAAFAGCAIDNAIVEVNGPEVPAMDGSAHPFVLLMECAGTVAQESPRRVLRVLKPIDIEDGERRAALREGGIEARIANYEMAFRMQTSIPEVTDLATESEATFALYGPDSKTPGTFAANCLQARRLAERGVRFIQLYHTNWDSHGGPGENLQSDFEKVCREVDQGQAALVQDLKARGLLEETLVLWGGEFGRTPKINPRTGRDHFPRAFNALMAAPSGRNLFLASKRASITVLPVTRIVSSGICSDCKFCFALCVGAK